LETPYPRWQTETTMTSRRSIVVALVVIH
jgi:hypothetical protein